MSARSERRKNHKRYWKLRKNRVWFSALIVFLISLVSVMFILLFSEIFTMFVINSKIESEYDAKRMLCDLYEKGLGADEDPYLIFDSAGMDYLLKDQDGNVLHTGGKNTCSETGYPYSMTVSLGIIDYTQVFRENTDAARITLYADTETHIISPDGKDSLFFDLPAFIAQLRTSFGQSDLDIPEIALPIWEAISLQDGKQTLLFKAHIAFRESDIGIVMVLLFVMCVLLLVVFAAMLIHAIASTLNQRRISKLFFTDLKIKGHNWLWFLFRSEHTLRSLRSAKRSYALVDLEFVGYRRFCICHSVDEGEAALCEIYQRLMRMLNPRELCAHSAEDSFALLLEYQDEASLKARIESFFPALDKIESDHRFVYHAGVFLIPAASGSGILTRRADVDVERDYNIACAACTSLENSDASAAAFYDEKLLEEQRWIDTVEDMQQKALEQEEFLIYYQPKYDPRSHVLKGAEALIRWQSPTYGFLSPYRFIPIFEKNGFITEIDHYMLAHVARAQRKWLDEGQHCVPISVNVSRAHFIESDLAEQIRDLVDKEGAPHDLIEIELTESAFFDDKKAMIDTINKLKEYGFAVSMDDFGSGYSSLNSLKDMPLDVLKLDAEFFRGDGADTTRAQIIVSEAIKLAKNLRMRTVAEGVEIKEQVEFLAAQGCDMIQGYYFAKPMPAEEYKERMIQGRNDGAQA